MVELRRGKATRKHFARRRASLRMGVPAQRSRMRERGSLPFRSRSAAHAPDLFWGGLGTTRANTARGGEIKKNVVARREAGIDQGRCPIRARDADERMTKRQRRHLGIVDQAFQLLDGRKPPSMPAAHI